MQTQLYIVKNGGKAENIATYSNSVKPIDALPREPNRQWILLKKIGKFDLQLQQSRAALSAML
jgi:hypothetical protein